MHLTHQLQALLITAIWGTNFVLIHVGLNDLPPFTFACLRFVLVAFPLIFFLPKPNTHWHYLVLFGLFLGFGQFGLLFWVMQENISPGLASLVLQFQVFFTILLSFLLMKERITQHQLLAILISFSGILVITFYTDNTTTKLGLAVALVAAFSWACSNLIVKKVGNVNLLAFLAWSAPFSVVPLFTMAYYLEGSELIVSSIQQASINTWLVVLWQAIGNTLIGYGLWNSLLNRYPAAMVTPWSLLVPVFGMSASALFLNENLEWWKLLAATLVMTGLILNTLINRSPTK